MPYFGGSVRPSVPKRKKLVTTKFVVLFAMPPHSPDLPIETVIEFLNTFDMVVTSH
jgi:hypothetical protein